MRFPRPTDEAQYRTTLAASLRRPLLFAWIVGTVVSMGSWFVDPYFIAPEAIVATRTVRFGMLAVAFGGGFILQALPPRAFARAWQPATAAAGALTLLAVTAVTLTYLMRGYPLDDRVVFYGVVSVVMITLGFHSAFGLSFVAATTATLFGGAVYLATFLALGDPRSLNGFLAFWVLGANGLGMISSWSFERFRRRDFMLRREIEHLLLNVLPAPIAERLKAGPAFIADGFADASILFADIVGFTDLAARLTPAQLVEVLNRLFSAFDDLAERLRLEKIKTIGDAYMVVGGVPEQRADHLEAIADMALAMREVVRTCAAETGHPLQVRIGIHCGPVVAGVIGKRKFAYDLWGDAVNTASRMESHGLPGEIQVTEAARARLAQAFVLRERGPITVKGKGDLLTFLLDRRL